MSQPKFTSMEDKEDWKDFRYSVVRTHQWVEVSETLSNVLVTFRVWQAQGINRMSVVENIEDEFKETKYPHLRVAKGGKAPPEGPTVNWLAELEVRTTFVARHRNSNDVDYNQYYVLYKDLPEVVLLKWILPDGKLLDYYVDPVRFSKMFPEYKILGIGPEEPQQEAEVSEDGGTK